MRLLHTIVILFCATMMMAQAHSMRDMTPEQRMDAVAASVRKPEVRNANYTLSGKITLKKLQSVIDKCAAEGGGMVEVPAGTHKMNGPLELRSNVHLHLKDGAILLFSGKAGDFLPPVLSRWEGTELYNRSSMIHADGCRNVMITGEGQAIIDANGGEMARWGMPGGDPNFKENVHGTHGVTPEKQDVDRLRQMGDDLTPVGQRVFGKAAKLRPCGIELRNCQGVLLEGIVLMNSPFWCIHPLYCEDVTVRNVTVESHFPNNDGCDPESCNRVLIEDCTFHTGDDAIAIKAGRDADGRRVGKPSENIVIRNCMFQSKCNGLCIGSEMSGGVRNVFMKNIEIGDVKNALLFKSNLDRGGYIENVFVDSVTIGNVAGAVLRFETNYFGYRGGHFPARYSDFNISNVTAKTASSYAIYYDGNDDEPITDITVRNFNVMTATNPYYIYKVKNCDFFDCKVNGTMLPQKLEESKERKSCDVW